MSRSFLPLILPLPTSARIFSVVSQRVAFLGGIDHNATPLKGGSELSPLGEEQGDGCRKSDAFGGKSHFRWGPPSLQRYPPLMTTPSDWFRCMRLLQHIASMLLLIGLLCHAAQ